jgi:S1-C subfamily serine protease
VINVENTTTDKINVQESSAIVDDVNKASPAVVSVTSTSQSVQNLFGYGTIEAPTVSGTGIIITSDGLIITNKHVVSGNTNFVVTTADGKTYNANVVATDPVTDIALLKVSASGLPVATLGDSSQLQVGQWVIAIGNALGEFQNTVTTGIVSGLNRVASPTDDNGNTENLDGLIQTDAAINPGNSGGPLLNIAGQVIGMNTAVSSDAQNLGFAITVNDMQKAISSYEKNGKILRPYLGIQYEELTPVLAKSLNVSQTSGALITSSDGTASVVSGSPAASAGLKDGDIITKVDNNTVNDTTPLDEVVRTYDPGDSVTLTVIRGGKTITVSLTLGTLGN